MRLYGPKDMRDWNYIDSEVPVLVEDTTDCKATASEQSGKAAGLTPKSVGTSLPGDTIGSKQTIAAKQQPGDWIENKLLGQSGMAFIQSVRQETRATRARTRFPLPPLRSPGPSVAAFCFVLAASGPGPGHP